MPKHTVEAAILALSSVDQDHASVNNGVGFNKRDSGFGNSLASWISEGKPVTPKQYALAYKILKTYRVQLQGFEIDYDQIPPPAITVVTPQQRTVDFRGGFFILKFPYLPDVKDALKASVKGARWEPDGKLWTVPEDQKFEVGRFAIAYKFQSSPEAMKQFSGQVSLPVEEEEEDDGTLAQDENWYLSWAPDADIDDVPLPEGLELIGFQNADMAYGLKNLKPGKGMFLADEMGLGKTPQGLLLLKMLKAYPAILAVPRVVWLKWAMEVQKWTPGLRIVMLGGKVVTPKTRLLAKRFGATIVKLGEEIPEADIYIVKYSVINRWVKPLTRKVGKSEYEKSYHVQGPIKAIVDPAGIIFDESQFLKEEKSQRTKAALALVTTMKPDIRLNLTGTAVLNRNIEWLTQLKLINRLDLVATSTWDFLNEYCNKNGYGNKGKFGYMEFDGSVNEDKLNHRLRSGGAYAQHEKQDRIIEGINVPGVFDQLPRPIPNLIPAELEHEGRYWAVHEDLVKARQDLYRATKKLESAVAVGAPPTQLAPLRAKVKAAENVCGVLSNEAWKVSGEEKVAFAIEHVSDWMASAPATEKIIVFGHHRDEVNQKIAEHFGCPIIIGGQNETVRMEAEESFQTDPNVRVLVCSIKAANVGINLTAATAMTFVEFTGVPGDLDQAIGRAHGRLNDVHGVKVDFLVYYSPDPDDPSIDEHFLSDLLDPKRSIFRRGVSGGTEKVARVS